MIYTTYHAVKTISAADANRQFSSVLRAVAAGERYTVLSRGKPVATIAPVEAGMADRRIAKAQLVERLQQQAPSGSRTWTRDELYDR